MKKELEGKVEILKVKIGEDNESKENFKKLYI